MRALILANGARPPASLAHRLAAGAGLVIATDGAARAAARLGLRVDIVSGDFDSIAHGDAARALPDALIHPTPDQELNDLEKAVALALERGAQQITCLGAIGSRWDHSLAAAALAARPEHAGRVVLRAPGKALIGLAAPDAPYLLPARRGSRVSLIALGAPTVLSASGLRWPLVREPLAPGSRGVSNVAIGGEVAVHVHAGAALLIHAFREPWPGDPAP